MACITTNEDREWIEEVQRDRSGGLPESVVSLVRRRLDEVDSLARQRDDLLAACKAALPFLLAAHSGMCLDADAEIEILRDSIAKADGKDGNRDG